MTAPTSALERLRTHADICKNHGLKDMTVSTLDVAKALAVCEAAEAILPLLRRYEGQGEGGTAEFNVAIHALRECRK